MYAAERSIPEQVNATESVGGPDLNMRTVESRTTDIGKERKKLKFIVKVCPCGFE